VIALPVACFLCALLLTIASSVWIPPGVGLGKAFWIAGLLLVALALIWPVFLLFKPDGPALIPALLVFGPIAAGWVCGTLVVLLVRVARRHKLS
jgi:hypothetical protein